MSCIHRCMKSLPVEQAIGSILCHDITQIIPGQSKGPVFRKGHIVQAEDVPVLLRVGEEHIYVYEPTAGVLHENDAALRLARHVAGKNLSLSDPLEGRVNFQARCHGLLQVDVEGLTALNLLDDMAVAVLHSLQEVKKDQTVGGARVIPLLIEEDKLLQAESLGTTPLLDILPFRSARVGVVTTGSEIYYGRVQDAFGPIVQQKFQALGSTVIEQRCTSDDIGMTSAAIVELIDTGANFIAVTGGMSVDPDDRTPAAIKQTGATLVSYGAPTFPGAMFLLAFLDGVPIVGLPGCVMYHKTSVFDLVVPRLLAGLEVTRQDIARLGHGGFCTDCPTCTYPLCAFGKG